MEIKDGGSFEFGKNAKIQYFTINIDDISNTKGNKDFDALIKKFFNRRDNRFLIFCQYEFYDVNGDFIEEEKIKEIFTSKIEFRFTHEDYVKDLKEVLNINKEEYLKYFNHRNLNESTYHATDVLVFRDDKTDKIIITHQIKIEHK